MADDYLKDLPVDQVASWYGRLADAWSKTMPELKPALAGAFLKTWVNNRNPKANIEFDAPAHLKNCSAVLEVESYHRDVFLTNKKARFTGGVEKWAGIVPRARGLPGFSKWDMKSPLVLEYQSLCDIAPDIWAIVRIQKSGTNAERDIFGSLRGFQLKSKVTVLSAPAFAGQSAKVQFTSWEASGTDRYDWDYSERLKVFNPDYQQNYPGAVRPQDKTLEVYHKNAKRVEDAGKAAPYNVVLRPWTVTDARLMGVAAIDLTRKL